MAQQRRHFDGTQKVAILKEHLVEKVPVSTLCDKRDISPSRPVNRTPGVKHCRPFNRGA